MGALTDLAARSVTPGKTRKELPDGRIVGLYLIVQTSGAKSWAFRYRFAGQTRKYTIGTYPKVPLATARNLALRVAGEVAQGLDPSVRKRDERAAAKAKAAAVDELVENVVDDFVKLYARKKTRDWRETERLLKKDVVGAWRGRRLAYIEKKHVVKLLDAIVERGAPVAANRVFTQLRKLCSWAVSRAILTASPCEGVQAPSPEVERDRVLAPDELALVWRAAEAIPAPYNGIVRMLVLTGARRDEVAGLQWPELDLAAATWTIPAARSKNRRENVVPLSAAALEILAPIPRVEKSPYTFGGGKAAPANFAKMKQRLDAKVVSLNGGVPIAHWTLHDIRRTVATELAGLNVTPHVVEAVLNHKSGVIRGVAAIYNRYSYAAEKRAALDAWARRLDAIVTGSKAADVVDLASAGDRPG